MFTENEIKIEPFPKPIGGMSTGKIPVGVRITHIKSGLAAMSTTERTMLENREIALKKLEVLVSNFNGGT